jgi:hypothetical protein
MDPALFGLKKEEITSDASFVTPEQRILKAKRRLAPQLAALGYRPQDITYLAMSHYR